MPVNWEAAQDDAPESSVKWDDAPSSNAPESKSVFDSVIDGAKKIPELASSLVGATPGIAASISRGAAPYAVGAGAGALVGGPPGAVAGLGAVALTDLTGAIYNPIAHATGLPQMPATRDLTDKALDAVGVQRPSNALERTVESATSGGLSAAGGAGAAKLAAEKAAPGVAKMVLGKLAEEPGKQVASGILGASSAQGAAEQGGSRNVQMAAGLAGGAMPYGGAGLRSLVSSNPRSAALEARHAGYVLPPASMSEKPGLVSSVLAGWGGKIKTQQAASARNQEVTNGLAAQSLGLPKETVLTEQVYNDIRAEAGKAYRDVIEAVPTVAPTEDFRAAVKELGGQNSQAAKYFPKITDNSGIKELVGELGKAEAHPTEAWVEVVKELRHNANANLKGVSVADPSKHALGLAQREAANLIDDLIEHNISSQTGREGVVDAYRQARRKIAMTYDLEAVTNSSSGDVNARGLAKLMDKGRPLNGELKTIADAAMAFPKAFQDPAAFGHNEPWSALDFFGSGAALAHGNPLLGAATLTRPVGRSLVLSSPVQDAMAGGRSTGVPLSVLSNPGGQSAVQPGSP